MALPPREYYSLFEVVERWRCSFADLAGWASVGRFDIVAEISPTKCGKDILAGFVAVPVSDLLPMFRQNGSGPPRLKMRRMRVLNSKDWLIVTKPKRGIEIGLEDLLIMAGDVRRFEQDCSLTQRPAAHIGSTAKYDWDGMYIDLIRRAHEQGVPATQAAWVGEVQDWFVSHSQTGDAPDERTIRRRITPIWKSLRDPCG